MSQQQQFNWVVQTPRTPTTATQLRGKKGRLTSGVILIFCGVIEVILAIILICIPFYGYSYYYYTPDRTDYVGWGIWNGGFGIMTGCFGAFGRQSKCQVITFMVTAILSAVMSSCCTAWALTLAVIFGYYGGVHLAMYIIISLAFFVQMVASIVGASFTCGAVCCTENNQMQIAQPMVYLQGQYPPHQQVPPVPIFQPVQQPAYIQPPPHPVMYSPPQPTAQSSIQPLTQQAMANSGLPSYTQAQTANKVAHNH